MGAPKISSLDHVSAGVKQGFQIVIIACLSSSISYVRWEINWLLVSRVTTMPKKYDKSPNSVTKNLVSSREMVHLRSYDDKAVKMMSSTNKSKHTKSYSNEK